MFELPRRDVLESIVARAKVFVQLRRTPALAKTPAGGQGFLRGSREECSVKGGWLAPDKDG